MSSSLVQYVVVRGDLLRLMNWPMGAVIAQACHASTAALHIYRDDANTSAYTENVDRMHKVVLEANDEAILRELSTTLLNSSVDHKLWIEQPENYATCLATKPYPKHDIQKYFKNFKLFK